MKTIEIKMYQNKLKMIREENSVVRMQLFDPSSISRQQQAAPASKSLVSGNDFKSGFHYSRDRNVPDGNTAAASTSKQPETAIASVKDDLIVDFNRVELTHDTVKLQEEVKDLQVENAVLKERTA